MKNKIDLIRMVSLPFWNQVNYYKYIVPYTISKNNMLGKVFLLGEEAVLKGGRGISLECLKLAGSFFMVRRKIHLKIRKRG